MAGILVGNKECSYLEITRIFDHPSISAHKLDWKLMATYLGLDQTDIEIIEGKYSIEMCIIPVIKIWRRKYSDKATLGNFIRDLPPDWNQLKDYVRDLIWEKSKVWNDLDEVLKERVLQSKVRFLGNECTLASLQITIQENFLNEHLPQKPFQEILICDEYNFPLSLPYYINRKLTMRQKLNPEIFKENCNDIFLFEGIEPYQLSMLEKSKQSSSGQPELTDDSDAQLKRFKFSVRFMRLKYQSDFNKIAQKTNHPVHRVKYNNDEKTFTWICSIGSISLITKYLLDAFEEICEVDFVTNNLAIFNPRPVAICSSPGMGKSFILKKLANRVKEHCPERFVIVLPLEKIIERLSKADSEINLDLVIDTLAIESSCHFLGYTILKQKMLNQSTNFEIFLYGFDEIPANSIQVAKKFLNLLHKTINIRCLITSRPHMTTELEVTMGVVIYNIAPFTTEDQINYFCDYWKGELGIQNNDIFLKFASMLIKSPSLLSTGIAGVPLQCNMLAQVYSEKVVNCCEVQSVDIQIINCSWTLLELYEKFLDYKFQRICEEDKKERVRKLHWAMAIDILFPQCPEAMIIRYSLETELDKTPVPNEIIFTVGILEAKTDLSCPQFTHRTYAEFLLAEFITEEFLKNRTDLMQTWTEFVYETVLELETETTTPAHFHSGNIFFSKIHELMDFQERLQKIFEFASFWKNGNISETEFILLELVMRSFQSPDNTILYKKDSEFDSGELQRIWRRLNFMQKTFQVKEMMENFDDLVCALYKLGWFQVADELERAVGYRLRKSTFLHSNICFFLDAILIKWQNEVNISTDFPFPVHTGIFSQLNTCSKTFLIKLLTCVDGCFENLTRILFRLCGESVYLLSVLQIDYVICQEIICHAAKRSNVEFFMFCCQYLELLASVKCVDVKFTQKITTKDFSIEYMQTPLHVSVMYGNYNVVEYLVNLKEIDSLKKYGLWQLCLHESCKDSDEVIERKIQILSYLKFKDMIVHFNGINCCGFPNEVHSKLFTKFCDVMEYTLREEDLKIIASHVLHYCDDSGVQMDEFVDWIHSKHLENFLTFRPDNGSSMLSVALRNQKVKVETFRKIFSLVPFDPYDILWNAALSHRCEDMIKAIVEITGCADQVDNAHRKRSLLHLAVFQGNLAAVEFLLLKGAKVGLKDDQGNTSLHLALNELYPDQHIVKLLLEHCVEEDLKIKNKKRKTPLALLMRDRGMWKWDNSVLQLFKEKYNLGSS